MAEADALPVPPQYGFKATQETPYHPHLAESPDQSHPFQDSNDSRNWSHQNLQAKKTMHLTDLQKCPTTSPVIFEESCLDMNGNPTAACDKQRETMLRDQAFVRSRGEAGHIAELLQPGDIHMGDEMWGVLREVRETHVPHWSFRQFCLKKAHHATQVHKTAEAAADVNNQSAAHMHFRDPKSWNRERGGSDVPRSHAELEVAKRRHLAKISREPDPHSVTSPRWQSYKPEPRSSRGAQQNVLVSPDEFYGTRGGVFGYPSGRRVEASTKGVGSRAGGSARGGASEPSQPSAWETASPSPPPSSAGQRSFGMTPYQKNRPQNLPSPGGAAANQIKRDKVDKTSIQPFYERSLAKVPRESPDVRENLLYRSQAELAYLKSLCKTDIRHSTAEAPPREARREQPEQRRRSGSADGAQRSSRRQMREPREAREPMSARSSRRR